MAEVLCKAFGMLVIAEVSPEVTVDNAACPQCRASQFREEGGWLQCICGFAYSIPHLRKMDSSRELNPPKFKSFVGRKPMAKIDAASPFDGDAKNEQRTKEMINHPSHYNQGGVECIEAIRSALTEEEFRGFTKGSAIRYLWRAEHKANPIEDLKKAVWYTQYEIDRRIAKAAAGT